MIDHYIAAYEVDYLKSRTNKELLKLKEINNNLIQDNLRLGSLPVNSLDLRVHFHTIDENELIDSILLDRINQDN